MWFLWMIFKKSLIRMVVGDDLWEIFPDHRRNILEVARYSNMQSFLGHLLLITRYLLLTSS